LAQVCVNLRPIEIGLATNERKGIFNEGITGVGKKKYTAKTLKVVQCVSSSNENNQ
jgi:hypothetical protein